jgi:hypothetical protein
MQDAIETGLIPPLNRQDACIFTKSEQILQEYAVKRNWKLQDVKTLIQDVLRHPEFNALDVDTNMHSRLAKAISDGSVQVHDMWKQGDGPQELKMYKLSLEKVMKNMFGDIRLEGHQHYSFQEYKNAKGQRMYACEGNGSLSFQLTQAQIGHHLVPGSIVVYIDGSFIKNAIPIRPVYGMFLFIYHIRSDRCRTDVGPMSDRCRTDISCDLLMLDFLQ